VKDPVRQARGKGARRKGAQFEREVVSLHLEAGVPATKVPLSGQLPGHPGDVLVEVLGGALAECKNLKAPPKTIERWLDGNTFVFTNRFRKSPLVHMSFETYLTLVRSLHERELMDECVRRMARGSAEMGEDEYIEIGE
jgi:Holliday junction resolvase